jgi:hypothetical protein
MMKKNTRKTNTFKKRTALSIPELKHAWDEIHKCTHDILKEGKPIEKQIKDFQKMWKKIFHRPVSSESAEAYLRIKRQSSSHKMGQKTRRKMKGGAGPLAGAPLDSTLQPGVYGSHGSFPAYQTSGLGFYDTINKQAILEDCGVKDTTPIIESSMGSNNFTGGGISLYSPLMGTKPPVPGIVDTVRDTLKGFDTGSSANPEVLSI